MNLKYWMLVFLSFLLLCKSGAGQPFLSLGDSLRFRHLQRDLPFTVISPKTPFLKKYTYQYDYHPWQNLFIISQNSGHSIFQQYASLTDYLKISSSLSKKQYWKTHAANTFTQEKKAILEPITIKSPAFERIFGGNTIEIIPKGSIDISLMAQRNVSQNPLLNERHKKLWGLELDQKLHLNLSGNIGQRGRITANFSSESEFDVDNFIKFDYIGKKNDILQRLEIGNVNFITPTRLMASSESLFGIKAQLQVGKLNITGVASQKNAEHRELTLSNGRLEREINISIADYEANQHFFLAHYFRDQYNESLKLAPLINSPVNITTIEVWLSNRADKVDGARDILALLDLGESTPYNTLITGNPTVKFPNSGLPNSATDLSNNLLELLGPNGRNPNSNAVGSLFSASGGGDNFVKLTNARRLIEGKDYTVNRKLGYISLSYPLMEDQVLAVAYRYTVNGREYQVGDLSTDIAFDASNPQMLYTKLLKNEVLKTNLPTWNLMMKNIYNLGISQISEESLNLHIVRHDENTALESSIMYEGTALENKSWLEIVGLDRLSQNHTATKDGLLDFIEGVTFDNNKGKLIFPLVEPFGKDLQNQFMPNESSVAERYVFHELYSLTKSDAIQHYSNKNRYYIKGTVRSANSSEFSLGVFDLKPNTVKVYAGAMLLQEGADYAIDYETGTLRLLNPLISFANNTIKVRIEDAGFGSLQKTFLGTRIDYIANNNLQLGTTLMKLIEKPFSEKGYVGSEPLSNTMLSADIRWHKEAPWLTRLLDKLPFIKTNEPSSINFYGEVAYLKQGLAKALTNAGTTYLDDFENNFSFIDIKNQQGWQLSSTPQLFPEHILSNDLSYGYNRAHLAFYNIDPIFYQSSSLTPAIDRHFLADHRTRKVTEQEVFPFKESKTGTDIFLPTLDLAYYPQLRGAYNFNIHELNANGELTQPQKRWGGMFKKINQPDFEAQNIEFLEMWLMAPSLTNPNKEGGDLYVNLGLISEDILKDGRKSIENAIPASGDKSTMDKTVWGYVPKVEAVNRVFESSDASRRNQDVGLDALNNEEERSFHSNYLNQLKNKLTPETYARFEQDPANDDYIYFRSNVFGRTDGIMERYKYINGTEGNSKTSQLSREAFGVDNAARTLTPDAEDIGRDNNMNEADSYYEYRISMRPQDMVVGQNFIVDEHTTRVNIQGRNTDVKWYKLRIPLRNYHHKYGNINDFKSIRFIRLFLTNFADTAVFRFATMQFVKSDWRLYNPDNSSPLIIADPALGQTPAPDQSKAAIGYVNIEENGKRSPIPYVVPPGINRQVDFANNNLDVQLNEQALSLSISNLKDGYGRAVYKTANYDLRQYGKLEMFVHAEGVELNDNDAYVFIRLGTDDRYHYYEYEAPLKITPYGSTSPQLIWPSENNIAIELNLLVQAKIARDNAFLNGQPWPQDKPFEYRMERGKITVKGSPDLSKVRFYMLGIKNPLQTQDVHSGQGKAISGEFWFNELRLTDLRSRSSWAATGELQLKLADLANISLSATKMTAGFGPITQRISEQDRTNRLSWDFMTNAELGKFVNHRNAFSIPLYFNFSKQIGTPEYNPFQGDVLMKTSLEKLSQEKKDSLLRLVQDYSFRKNFSIINARKLSTAIDKKLKPWHIENFSLSYHFSEYQHRDLYTYASLQKNYRGALDYTFTATPNYRFPLQKNKLLRSFNYNLMPSLLSFRLNVNRIYHENTFRDNASNNILPTYYSKNFNMSRIYGISWDLTKSLRLDFNATNYSIIEEPDGRINGAKKDTLWNNFWRMGTTVDYHHMMNLTYTLPLQKIPYLEWLNITARYGSQFNWQREPLAFRNYENVDFGHSIQNNRTIQINPTLNFNSLYSKVAFLRKNTLSQEVSFRRFMAGLLTTLKYANAAYTKIEGSFLPGYLPLSNMLGYSFSNNAPGWDFIFGSQTDIRQRAQRNGWLTTDSLQNENYTKTYSKNLSAVIHAEPLKYLKIDFSVSKMDNKNYSSPFHTWNILPDYITGNYSVTQAYLKTSFRSAAHMYEDFLHKKLEMSEALGTYNPNSTGIKANFFSDGYDENQQDVVVNAFLQTYLNKKIKIGKSNRPDFPIPNWRLNYNGLSKILGWEDWIPAINILHGYQSLYSIVNYHSNTQYQEEDNYPFIRDGNGNFIPQYQYSQITLTSRFVPLLGLDIRFRNNWSINTEYRKVRDLNLTLQNSQLAVFDEQSYIAGIGYRKLNTLLPFGLFQNRNWKSDVNFRVDIALNDRKVSTFRTGIAYAQITGGNKSITLNPSLDYTINRLYNIRLFYNTNAIKPYTSETFASSTTFMGINFKILLQ